MHTVLSAGRFGRHRCNIGDLGYILESGDIVCQGGAGDYPKINGHRIKLGEILHQPQSLLGMLQATTMVPGRYR